MKKRLLLILLSILAFIACRRIDDPSPSTVYSYVGVTVYTSMAKQSWIAVLGSKNYRDGGFYLLGSNYGSYTSSVAQAKSVYVFALSSLTMYPNDHSWGQSYGLPIRCIEDCMNFI